MNIYYVPDIASHFIFIISLKPPNNPKHHYYSHLTDEKTKAEQNKELNKSELCSKNSKPDLSASQFHAYFSSLVSDRFCSFGRPGLYEALLSSVWQCVPEVVVTVPLSVC